MNEVQPSGMPALPAPFPSIAEQKSGSDQMAPVRLDPRILEQMQRTIRELTDRYSETVKAQVGSLLSFVEKAGAGDDEARAQLYATAHEIRGLAGTFGYPVVGRFAHSLCGYMERYRTIQPAVMRFHIEAMYDGLKRGGADEDLTQETLASLERLTAVMHEDGTSAG